MKLIFGDEFMFYTSSMHEIYSHCHWLGFSSFILNFGQCVKKPLQLACLDQFALLLDVPKYRPPWNNPIKIRWQDKFSRWSTCLFFFKQTRATEQIRKIVSCSLGRITNFEILNFPKKINQWEGFWQKKHTIKTYKILLVRN